MSHEEPEARRFYAISYDDDTPQVAPGSLIPARSTVRFTPSGLLPAPKAKLLLPTRQFVALAAVLLLITASAGSAVWWRGEWRSQVASVTELPHETVPVVVEHPYTATKTPLTYGVQVAFAEPNFFTTTRDAFIEGGKTFIEVDLAAMQLRYFESGILVRQLAIASKGEAGTFWETPAGLYKVEQKKTKHYSTVGQVYLPFSISFQGNFFIHGEPYVEGGEPLPTDFRSGGVALATSEAEALFSIVRLGTPVLVYERPTEPDQFLYEPKIPELATPHYLIADVKSSTVLASSDLDAVVPIASLTKLMTAVVAAEYINLDTRVPITQPTFVQSLIPRLGDRSSVSMYSLLELLLLESSNEAAEVIASEVGREQFIAYMNERAAALGMEHTNFADPSGLSADNTSSVGDLLRLIQYIYEKRRFIVDMSAGKKLPDLYVTGEFSGLSNFNDVAGLENFIGGKIGETAAAGQTSVTLHTLTVKGETRIVAIIILGSEGRTADVQALMKYATERFGT